MEVAFSIRENIAGIPVLPEKNFFTAAQLLDPQISGDGIDWDGDGRPNLLEYFLGSSPIFANHVPAEPLQLLIGFGGDQLVLDRSAAAQRQGWGICVEWSDDLINWNPMRSPSGIFLINGSRECAIYQAPVANGFRVYRARVYR